MALFVHSESGDCFVATTKDENVQHNEPRLAPPRGGSKSGHYVKGKGSGGQIMPTQLPGQLSLKLPAVVQVDSVPAAISKPLGELATISGKVLSVAQGCAAVDAQVLSTLQAKAFKSLEKAVVQTMGETAAIAATAQYEQGYTAGMQYGLAEGRSLAEVIATNEKHAEAAAAAERTMTHRAEVKALQDALDEMAKVVAGTLDRALGAERDLAQVRSDQLRELLTAIEQADNPSELSETHPMEDVTQDELNKWFDGLTTWQVAD